MRTEGLTSCFELLQKLRARLESRLTGVKPKDFITDLSNAVLLIWFTVLLVLVLFLYCFYLLCVFYDIGIFYDKASDGMVTLWERAAQSVYNMFSVPCQEPV